MQRNTAIGLAAVALLAIGGAVVWADEAPTPADAVSAPVDAPLATPGDPQGAGPRHQGAAGQQAVAAAVPEDNMHEEMMTGQAHEMAREHGAREMHEEMMRDRQMPPQTSGMPTSGAQGGAAMNMGDPCSGSGCKAGDSAPVPMPMGHM